MTTGKTISLLPERDAADVLGLSIAWMQKARYLGTGPRYIKVGGKTGRAVRYRYVDLIAYITANAVVTTHSDAHSKGSLE